MTVQGESAGRQKPGSSWLRANGAGDEEGISLVGPDFDMFEESVAAGGQPVVADEGAIAQ